VAAVGQQAAEALHYAHVHHTLHRDIKPANLLLDRQGMVWITDFGLAKAMEQDHVTQTGGLVGTLRYMAPEQFSGQIDTRSDIYSLGLTLYELLTLRPGFEDSSRSGLIGQITHGEPLRPRKINPQIPRDLETIALKAIARDPAHRYQSAGDLARDLQCYLEDRPIQARRVSAAERVWRWARRNRVVTALGTSTLLLLIVTLVLTSLGYVGSRHAKLEEEKLRQKAEATSALALDALDNIFQRFAPDRTAPTSRLTVVGDAGEEIAVPVQPVLSKEAAAMLEQMLAFYDRLAEQSGGDARLRRKVAEANRRVGDIRQRLGHFEQSKAAYLRAIAAYRQLALASPQDVELRTEIARIQNELGNVHWAIHDPEAGHSSYADALATLLTVPAVAAAAPRYQYELARTYYFMGKRPGHEPGPPPIAFGRRPGRQPDGAPWKQDGPKPGDDWRGPPPGNPPPDGPPPDGPPLEDRDGAMAERRPGAQSPFRRFDPETQQENLHKAIDLLERLVADHPQVPDYRHLLARCYREVRPPRQNRPLSASEYVAAVAAMNKATQILQKLAQEYPDVPDYRQDLCETYAMLDEQRMFSPQDGGLEAAKRLRGMMEKGLAISEALVAEHPNVPDYALTQIYIRLRLGGLLQQSDPATAQAHLEKALELQTALTRRFPQTASYNIWMAIVQESLGVLLQQRGKLAEARKMQEASIESVRKLVAGDPHAGMLRGLLAYKYTRLADLLRQMKDEPAATEALRQAEQLRQHH
jgi:tetratricopeptide (TPR) repeat protein